MRQPKTIFLCLLGTVALAACENSSDAEVERARKAVNAIDESNLGDLMLNVADPEEAVAYFRRTLADNPDRIDVMRGLAKSLVRARRPSEAVPVWARVAAHPEVTNDDKVDYAGALIRSGEWNRAKEVLDGVPPTHESFERYRLEAMVADSSKDWSRADSFYEIAIGLTTQPSAVLNNWGYSKLTRGDYPAAERLFSEALTYDRSGFTAKNNLVLARGAQRNYTLPIVQMTQIERAELLHTLALTAIKQGDITIGKELLEQAIETHPQYFEAAVLALRALESGQAG
ncbi:MAG: tetratricopeptide repeat protein [Paracoccaceae bacterium]|nr:tetratricopeptide repeat protein [Paracoccaceae bacterium]